MKIALLVAVTSLVALVEIEAGKSKRAFFVPFWKGCCRKWWLLKRDNRQLRRELDELQKNITDITNTLASKEGQLTECKVKLQGAESRITLLENDLNQTRAELEECRSEPDECTDIKELQQGESFTVALNSTERSEGDIVQISCGYKTKVIATCTRAVDGTLDWSGTSFSKSEELKSYLRANCNSLIA